MGLYKRPDTPGWWFSLSIKGRRFREPCGTEDRAHAGVIFRRRRDEMHRLYAAGGKPEITLNDAFVRYWDEHAERLASADNIYRIGNTLIAGLGRNTLLSRIERGDLATFVATRRNTLADGSVNRELTILRAVMRMAVLKWGCAVAEIDWKRQFLAEPPGRDRFLTEAEEVRLFTALRPDFHALVRFALLSGVRVSNARTLRWDQIAWDEGVARLRTKSKRPGGDTLTIVITRAMRAILAGERDRNKTYVFTFIPQRGRTPEKRAVKPAPTLRLPFTRDGWRKSWQHALMIAGITDLRFHDLRHTFGTRLYRATGDIRKVQKAIGHRDIHSTLRYENSGVEDIRAAMELLDPVGDITAKRRPR